MSGLDDIDIFGVPVTGSTRDRDLDRLESMVRGRYIDPLERQAKDIVKNQVVKALSGMEGVTGAAIAQVVALADSQDPNDKLVFNQIVSRLNLPVNIRRMGDDYMASKRFEGALGRDSSVDVMAYRPDEGETQYSLGLQKRFPNLLGKNSSADVSARVSTMGDPEIRARFEKRFAEGGEVDIFEPDALDRSVEAYENLPLAAQIAAGFTPAGLAADVATAAKYGRDAVRQLIAGKYGEAAAPAILAALAGVGLIPVVGDIAKKYGSRAVKDSFDSQGKVLGRVYDQRQGGYTGQEAIAPYNLNPNLSEADAYADLARRYQADKGQGADLTYVMKPERTSKRPGDSLGPKIDSRIHQEGDEYYSLDGGQIFKGNAKHKYFEYQLDPNTIPPNTKVERLQIVDGKPQKVGDFVHKPILKGMFDGGEVDIFEAEAPRRSPDAYRRDGSLKSQTGFLGPIINKHSGKPMTELSIGVEIGGREVEIPSMVPTLTEEERILLQNLRIGVDPVPKSIAIKAKRHAMERIKAGLNPFLPAETR